jgi:N-formylglutamate amidohydrolase
MDMRADPLPERQPLGGADASEGEAPYVLIEPLRRTAPLVFASPHSGTRYPQSFLASARASLMSLRRSEDPLVDELFAPNATAYGAPMLCATFARAFVDLNRDPGELDCEMFLEAPSQAVHTARVQAGLGAIPKIAGDGQEIYWRRLPLGEVEARLAGYHRPYHSVLAGLLDDALTRFGCGVLVDCHSMPSSARGPHAPDIVLGDRFGASCHPSITALVEASLRKMGYRVARNAPFAGGYTTQHYGRPGQRTHALQIEINRSLYLDERTLERSHNFARVRADMGRLIAALAEAELHLTLA